MPCVSTMPNRLHVLVYKVEWSVHAVTVTYHPTHLSNLVHDLKAS